METALTVLLWLLVLAVGIPVVMSALMLLVGLVAIVFIAISETRGTRGS